MFLDFFAGEFINIIKKTKTGEDKRGNPIYITSKERIEAIVSITSNDNYNGVDGNLNNVIAKIILPKSIIIEDNDIFEIRKSKWKQDSESEFIAPMIKNNFIPNMQIIKIIKEEIIK